MALNVTASSPSDGYYNYFFKDLGDPRIYDWPLMADPMKVTYICLFYLYMIYYLLPNYMAKKQPFDLKRVIQFYNVFQIVFCSVLAWGLATSGWTTYFSWGCQPVDYSDNPLSIRMAKFMWLTHILKIIDLVEAVFFILRKKFNQVSPLHVYHHVTMVYSSWIATKYCPGGMASFYPMLNHCVHVVMYAYYLLATLGPDMQKRLTKYKSKITMMQMVQFTIMLVHISTALPSSCPAPKVLICLFTPNLLVIFYMFYKFYMKNYCGRSDASVKKTEKVN